MYPQVTAYTGIPEVSFDVDDTATMAWSATIALSDDEDENADPIGVGSVTFLTARMEGGVAGMLDSINADMAMFSEIVDGDELAPAVASQFESICPMGLIILDQIYLHQAVRGHDLGAWAVAQVIHQMTFGGDQFIVTHPSPPGGAKLPKAELKRAQKRLTQHWQKVGLRPLDAAPPLMAQSTVFNDLGEARARLAPVADVRIEVDANTFEALKRDSRNGSA
jgi:hypothetical protein